MTLTVTRAGKDLQLPVTFDRWGENEDFLRQFGAGGPIRGGNVIIQGNGRVIIQGNVIQGNPQPIPIVPAPAPIPRPDPVPKPASDPK